jgi:hypothetical protein
LLLARLAEASRASGCISTVRGGYRSFLPVFRRTTKGRHDVVFAIAGTGLGLIGLLVVILLVILIVRAL